MARRAAKKKWDAIRAEVFGLLQHGATVSAVAKEVGVTRATVRRWQRRWTALCTASLASPVLDGETVSEMLRREAPAVARVILNQAKEGDTRAAALVMKLLGTSLDSEASEDGDPGADATDLARELDSLPPSVAYEIVGLLAQVGSASAGGHPIAGETAGEGEVGPVHLPWSEDGPASDEGGDEV